MSEKTECVVIGAGVVGLAVARAMQLRGMETVVLESERIIGTGTSSRNSEVIHAGIYYARDSLKARFSLAHLGQRHETKVVHAIGPCR